MTPHSPRRDRQLGMVWWPEMPSVHHRLAVVDDPIEALRTGICPYCGAGPYTVVAGHTVRAHGIDRFALRDAFGLTFNTSICDPTHSKAVAERSREQMKRHPEHLKSDRPPRKRRLSKAAQKIAREKILAVQSPEQSLQAALANQRKNKRLHSCTAPDCCNLVHGSHNLTCSEECKSRNVARKGFASVRPSRESQLLAARHAGDTNSIPHPCPVCGTEVKMRRLWFCSDECRDVAAQRRSDRLVAFNKARAAERTPIVPTCHPERDHCALGLCEPCYRRQNRERRAAEGLPYQ